MARILEVLAGMLQAPLEVLTEILVVLAEGPSGLGGPRNPENVEMRHVPHTACNHCLAYAILVHIPNDCWSP